MPPRPGCRARSPAAPSRCGCCPTSPGTSPRGSPPPPRSPTMCPHSTAWPPMRPTSTRSRARRCTAASSTDCTTTTGERAGRTSGGGRRRLGHGRQGRRRGGRRGGLGRRGGDGGAVDPVRRRRRPRHPNRGPAAHRAALRGRRALPPAAPCAGAGRVRGALAAAGSRDRGGAQRRGQDPARARAAARPDRPGRGRGDGVRAAAGDGRALRPGAVCAAFVVVTWLVVKRLSGFGRGGWGLFLCVAVFAGIYALVLAVGRAERLDLAVVLRSDQSAIGGYYVAKAGDAGYPLTPSPPGGGGHNGVRGRPP